MNGPPSIRQKTPCRPPIFSLFGTEPVQKSRGEIPARRPETSGARCPRAAEAMAGVRSGVELFYRRQPGTRGPPPRAEQNRFIFPRCQRAADAQSATKLLAYLPDYDKAIVRTTMIRYCFIFGFVWWFLSAVFALTKMADEQKPQTGEKSV